MQNGYIESFDGRFRDEWFQTLPQAPVPVRTYCKDYNGFDLTAASG